MAPVSEVDLAALPEILDDEDDEAKAALNAVHALACSRAVGIAFEEAEAELAAANDHPARLPVAPGAIPVNF